MAGVAASFEVRLRPGGSIPDRVCSAFGDALSRTRSPTGALVFCSPAQLLAEVGAALAARFTAPPADTAGSSSSVRPLPILAVTGPGVLSDQGEFEDEPAVTGVVFGGARVEIRSVDTPSVNARSIGELVAPDPQAQSSSPTFLFVRSEGFEPDELWRARKETSNPLVFGAGTHGSPGILHLQDGDVRAASAAALRVRGLVPVVRVAYSCRLLSPLLPITRTEGSMVLELDGRPALSILESLGKDLEGRPLLFTVLARHPGEWDGPAQEMLVRGIQGVDPERGGLVVGKELPDERYMTFGIHDAGAARDSFQALCRQLDRELAGAAPRFGVFLTYSGRGRIPHHAGGADTRALRERFPKLPFAGLHSAFEIAPHAGKPALQLYTGVLVVFSSPS